MKSTDKEDIDTLLEKSGLSDGDFVCDLGTDCMCRPQSRSKCEFAYPSRAAQRKQIAVHRYRPRMKQRAEIQEQRATSRLLFILATVGTGIFLFLIGYIALKGPEALSRFLII